ncbi:unnamed protein product [Medioppia subpectinata]|uniref:Uncharacterized protein n=1 Tax=Medioppia subpectinata TaxID=1979941 RepID=A0A7R9KRZ9_9ACAR|nr:unnamed protein product [Medioppia subpectinata]CAG2108729.1 unnamed protein product [Medioppia subpectinata]
MLVLLFILIVVFLYYNAQLMDKLKAALTKNRAADDQCICRDIECNDNCTQTKPFDEKSPLLADRQTSYSIQYPPNYSPDLSYEILDTSLEISRQLDAKDKGSCVSFLYGVVMSPMRLLMYLTIVSIDQSLVANNTLETY